MKTNNLLKCSLLIFLASVFGQCREKVSDEPVVFIDYPTYDFVIAGKDSIKVFAQINPKHSKLERYQVTVTDSAGAVIYQASKQATASANRTYEVSEGFINLMVQPANLNVEVCGIFKGGGYICQSNPFRFVPEE